MDELKKKFLNKHPDPQEWTSEWSRKEILELQAIWSELQELLEHSVYAVIGKHSVVICEIFPVYLRNEEDCATFETIRKIVEYSKKDIQDRNVHFGMRRGAESSLF